MTRCGMKIFHVGFAVLLINFIQFVWVNFGMLIVFVSIVLMLLGAFSVNYHTKKIKLKGYILFEDGKTIINEKKTQTVLFNSEYNVKLLYTGYKGKSNYIPFLTIGAFTTNPGVNAICFYNEKCFYRYEILVKSKLEYYRLKGILKKYKNENG